MLTKYTDIRPSIKSGDLLAWSKKGWSTLYDLEMQLIRMVTRSEYIHVGVAWVIGERVFVIEAVMPKVRVFPLSKLMPFYHISLNNPWKKETEEFALAQIGCEYSIKHALKSIMDKPNFDKDEWQCAQLANEILKIDGMNLGDVYTPSKVVESALSYSSGLKLISC